MAKQFKLDFSQIPSNTIEPGEYPAVISEVKLVPTKDGTSQNLNWVFELTEGEHMGRKLYFTTSLKEKALWKVKETFEVLGIEDEELVIDIDEETGLMIEPEVIGIPVIIATSNDTYQNRPVTRVDSILSRLDAADGLKPLL